MEPPYSGPETSTSLRVLQELAAAGLPEPVMLLGGWAVYFLVTERWKEAFGEDYFGSRDIDFGFHTPADAPAEAVRAGNLPATLSVLVDEHHFHKEGMYQLARYHKWETNEIIDPDVAKGMPTHEYYAILIDLIASDQREDLREIAGFQAFSEPLLDHCFSEDLHRTEVALEGLALYLPAPHVLVAMKLGSLPSRQKDHKSIKDLCDLYALVTASGVDAKTLRSRVHRVLPGAKEAVERAVDSPFIEEASKHLDQESDFMRGALRQLL